MILMPLFAGPVVWANPTLHRPMDQALGLLSGR